MRFKDMLIVALRNLSAGKSMVRKMIFAMSFIVMIIISFVAIVESYYKYKDKFNKDHSVDCYYYSELDAGVLSGDTISDIMLECNEKKQNYQAEDMLMLTSIELKDSEEVFFARDTGIVIDGKDYEANYKRYNRSKFYQNIQGKDACIELGFYTKGMKIFTDDMINRSPEQSIIGEFPENPGEIMLDTYILSVYGIENIDDTLIGNTISIVWNTEDSETVLFRDYVLTGIFASEMLELRESVLTKDYHLEHIYVNPVESDLASYQLRVGNVRYYFNNYTDYTEHYVDRDRILSLDVQSLSNDPADVMLTPKGMEFMLMNWIMDHIGKLLIIIAFAIGLIVTFSLLYIFQFYRDRNARYLQMLHDIGMTKKNRFSIISIEMSITTFLATLLGIYITAILLILLNILMKSILSFEISLNIGIGCIAILASWLYFGLCFGISLKEQKDR